MAARRRQRSVPADCAHGSFLCCFPPRCAAPRCGPRTLRTECCQMFFSLSRDRGLSKKSTAPSFTERITSSVDAPSAISTTGVSSKESTKERPTASSGATMHDCMVGVVKSRAEGEVECASSSEWGCRFRRLGEQRRISLQGRRNAAATRCSPRRSLRAADRGVRGPKGALSGPNKLTSASTTSNAATPPRHRPRASAEELTAITAWPDARRHCQHGLQGRVGGAVPSCRRWASEAPWPLLLA